MWLRSLRNQERAQGGLYGFRSPLLLERKSHFLRFRFYWYSCYNYIKSIYLIFADPIPNFVKWQMTSMLLWNSMASAKLFMCQMCQLLYWFAYTLVCTWVIKASASLNRQLIDSVMDTSQKIVILEYLYYGLPYIGVNQRPTTFIAELYFPLY